MRFAVALLLASTISTPLSAQPAYVSDAPIAYMIDLGSGAVLYDKNGSKKIPPASMAKMMTAYVVFDLVASKKLRLDQKFTVSRSAWEKWHGVGSTMFLNAGEKVSVSDLLHGLDTLSGNDAAIVLAEGIDGSEAKFVERMNATAMRLEMHNSRFGTANGWPDGGKTRTTAYDLATLAERTIHDFPELYKDYYGQASFRWNGVTQPNRDPLLGKVKGADGLKTGHTDEAGYCFTGTATQNGRRVVMVVAGLKSSDGRLKESRRFMQWGFDAWRPQLLYKAEQVVTDIPVQLGNKSHISVLAARDFTLTLPAKGPSFYKLSVRYNGPVQAPFEKGARVAELIATMNDGSEQRVPLIAAQAVSEAGFLGRAWNGFKSLVYG